MDVGTISIVLVVGLVCLLAIGMPLGFASAVLALLVMVMKFEPTLLTDPFSFGEGLLTKKPGTGPLYILTQKIFDLLTEYVLISVPLFIFMAALLERSDWQFHWRNSGYRSFEEFLGKLRSRKRKNIRRERRRVRDAGIRFHWKTGREATEQDLEPVSYTHLTLPTKA